jgi:radical SAM enzyme (TIGR01210 family)
MLHGPPLAHDKPAGDRFGHYPVRAMDRDRWILSHRVGRQEVSAFVPHGFFAEKERADTGQIISVATVLLTNRECPWRCLMCDLWKTTLSNTVPEGAIPAQIDYAFSKLRISSQEPGFQQLKLYNGGSFFDRAAIPPADYQAIADRVSRFDRVIVECHPSLVRERAIDFRDQLARSSAQNRTTERKPIVLEVAMGLETVHPEVLERLNKRMTLDQFERAAKFLERNGMALRAFVLVKPPFLDEVEGRRWAERSIDFAFGAGAGVVSLIPTRSGNGAMEELERQGLFSPPRLATLEAVQAYGIGLRKGRVFADTWDLERFSDCPACFPARRKRLETMNVEQRVLPPVTCACRAEAGNAGKT